MPPLGLEALDFLALNHNLLTVLSASHFEGLPGLSSLELDYNKIAKIDTAAFKGLESKKSIWERASTWYIYDLQVNCNSCRSLTTNRTSSLPRRWGPCTTYRWTAISTLCHNLSRELRIKWSKTDNILDNNVTQPESPLYNTTKKYSDSSFGQQRHHYHRVQCIPGLYIQQSPLYITNITKLSFLRHDRSKTASSSWCDNDSIVTINGIFTFFLTQGYGEHIKNLWLQNNQWVWCHTKRQ